MLRERFLDRQLLYDGRFQQFLRELLTSSGVFWMFDLVRQVTGTGFTAYLTSPAHWVLFGSGVVQAWVISGDVKKQRWWHHFIAPLCYTVFDIGLEGFNDFASQPYHVFYWFWAAAMAAAYLIHKVSPSIATLLKSLLLVLLMPVNYALDEWTLARTDLIGYWLGNSSHLFILLGTVVLGLMLGVTSIMRERFERLLYQLAGHFEQIASWSFDTDLMQDAYNSSQALALQRQERTLLFMDIRGFTPWSEAHQPHEVVEVVNCLYRTAEPIVKAHHGFKIQMTGDEIMTRFYAPDEALAAARDLQIAVANAMTPYSLSAGIGLHSGEIIEGLVGGEHTRQYGIFGDVVNVAARLQGQAKAGEIVISQSTWDMLTDAPVNANAERRELSLKGKQETMPVIVLPLTTGAPVLPTLTPPVN